MNKCTFISRRYLKGKKSRLAGSHWLSLLGIIIGVSALLIILSVMNGMREVVIERILASSAEIEIDLNAENDIPQIINTLNNFEFTKYLNPVYEEDLVILAKKQTILAKFVGINLTEFKKHNQVLNKLPYSQLISDKPGLIYGHNNLDLFTNNGAFIGYELARRYSLNLGDEFTVISLGKSNFSSIGQIPLTKNFTIQGIYSNLIPELELGIVYVSDSNLQNLTQSKQLYNKIELYSKDFSKANTYKKQIQALLENNSVTSWNDKNSNLYDAQKLEKNVMSFVLSLIIILSSFNLSGSFLKKVSNKKKELGILSTIGYSQKDIMKIFLYQGIILGFAGVAVGNMLAYSLLIIQLKFNIISMPSNIVHIFPTLPISIQLTDFILVTLFSLTFSIVSSLFPIYRIKKLNPIDLIKE